MKNDTQGRINRSCDNGVHSQAGAKKIPVAKTNRDEIGASEGIRTLDIHLGKVKLYH